MLKTITHESGALDIRIVLIDDHELFLAGLLALIQDEPGLTVVGQALNRAQAFDVARTKPDIIVLDLLLGSDNSLEFLSELIEAAEGARVLVLTGVPDRELHLRAVRLGAMGVMLKLESSSCLFKAIRKVYGGEIWLNRSMMAGGHGGSSQARRRRKGRPRTGEDRKPDFTRDADHRVAGRRSEEQTDRGTVIHLGENCRSPSQLHLRQTRTNRPIRAVDLRVPAQSGEDSSTASFRAHQSSLILQWNC